MTRYLVVAHQTAESPELVAKIRELATADAGAEFTILVPATPIQHLLTWLEGEQHALALDQARAGAKAFEAAGARVADSLVGDAAPIQAIGDELRSRPNYYKAIVICTFPQALSRWLKLDLLSQAQRTSNLPIIHVEAQPVPESTKQ